MEDSISREQFKSGNFSRHSQKGTRRKLVTEFLKKNQGKAWTIKGIVKRVKVSENSVRGYMKNLRKSGDVSYDSPYFIWRTKLAKVKKRKVKPKKSKKVKKKPVRKTSSKRKRK